MIESLHDGSLARKLLVAIGNRWLETASVKHQLRASLCVHLRELPIVDSLVHYHRILVHNESIAVLLTFSIACRDTMVLLRKEE